MQRILNLNHFAGKILLISAVLGIVLPGMLFLISSLLIAYHFDPAWAVFGMRASFAVGSLLFIFLVLLIILEQIQDHYLARRYDRSRNRMLQISIDVFECPSCGNRKISPRDRSCSVCGQEFDPID